MTRLSTSMDNTGGRYGGRGKGRHFLLEIGGTRLAFCYIRKNASTAFKGLARGESPYRDRAPEVASDYDFLQAFHGVKLKALRGADHRVLVLRDPATRVAAAYRNKFVQRDGNEGIFGSFAGRTGSDPCRASFRDFVAGYLRGTEQPDLTDLDKHVWSQEAHLAKVVYDTVLPMKNLQAVMTGILGAEMAETYFGRPANPSSAGDRSAADHAADIPAGDLAAAWRDRGALPTDDQLYDPGLRAVVERLYARDFELVAEMNAGLG